MSLLISNAIGGAVKSGIKFTFQYVSINIRIHSDLTRGILPFTFQYVSINIRAYTLLLFSQFFNPFLSTSNFFPRILNFPLNFFNFSHISYILSIVDLPIFLHYRRSTIFLQQKSSFIFYLTKKFFV